MDLFEHWIRSVQCLMNYLSAPMVLSPEEKEITALLSWEGDAIYEIKGDIFDRGSYLEVRSHFGSKRRHHISPRRSSFRSILRCRGPNGKPILG